MAAIKLIQGGLLSTIQDKGRYGYMQYGMMPAGAMDEYSLYLANHLVGNDPTEAVIETAYVGPVIEFDCDEVVAVTGARTTLRLNGEIVPLWQTLYVKTGDRLALEPAQAGVYNYIAFSRGLDVPDIMGSKSTYLRGKMGGLDGRKLQAGDVIALGDSKKTPPQRLVPLKHQPDLAPGGVLRVVMGPQEDYFTPAGRETFLTREYTITDQADRMGYRLAGEVIEHRAGPDVISDGIAHGTVQVPGNGQPIVLLSDRGTTGGYTKIATVIAPDICRLVQMSPGGKIRFEAIDVALANQIYREVFGDLESRLQDVPEKPPEPSPEQADYQTYQVEWEGRHYRIRIRKL